MTTKNPADRPRQRRHRLPPIYLTLRADLRDPATGSRVAAFVPATDADRSALRERGFRRNQRVRAYLTAPRNERFNRLVHGMGKLIVANIPGYERFTSHEALKQLQTEARAYCDEYRFDVPGLGQLVQWKARSMAFDAMGEETFQDFWRLLCEHLIATYWPNLDEQKITEMAEVEAVRCQA